MKYPWLRMGTIEAVVNRLGGKEGVKCLLSGKSSVVETIDFFRPMWAEIQIPALLHPTPTELKAKFNWIDRIESDTSPEDAVTLALGTVLRPGEERINSKEYEQRRASLAGRMFGYQQLQFLVDHQDEHPAFKALLGQIYIDGPGLVVVSAGGYRHFPYLHQDGRRWYLHWRWTGLGLNRYGRFAVSGK